jgi:cytochrome c biogenesis protein CcmG, thiol:disulfide interchange protein DsbE
MKKFFGITGFHRNTNIHRITLNAIIAFMLILGVALAKDSKIPSVTVEDMQNKKVDTKTFSNNGRPMIILFWATWCKPCIQELKAFNEVYEDWKKETGVKIIAVSIDDARSSKKVASFVKGRDWKYDVYIDENSDFRRAMNVNNPPHSFLIDGKGNIVWQHNGYAPGDEDEMYKELKKLGKK